MLRAWLGIERDAFYDTSRIAIVPMGLCYPGTVDGADLPPCRECAPLWQPRFRAALPDISLTLLVGSYAQAYYLGRSAQEHAGRNGARVSASTCPSSSRCRTRAGATSSWLKKNPWFANEVIPALRRRVNACIATGIIRALR